MLIEALPSSVNGGLLTRTVRVSPGETVVDTLGRVLPLAAGLNLLQPDGRRLTYTGDGPIDLPQIEVTFHLRPNLRWSDGAPLTALDSVFAFDLGRSPDATDPRALIAQRTLSYTAPDATTLVWTGLPGYVDPLAFTHLWPPLPRHRYQGLTPVEIADSPEANRTPLSYGPFVVEAWTADDQLVLTRNPHYWRAAEGLPRLDRLDVLFLDDSAVLANALRSALCQLAPSSPALDEAAPALAADPAVRLQRVPGPILEHLDFNLSPAEGLPLLADLRVRQALAHCLDRAALSPDPAWPVPDTYLPPGHPFHAPEEVTQYPFDPPRGRALLAEAAWPADQVITLSGGPADNPTRAALLHALTAQWQAHCGLTVSVRLLTEGELLGDWPLGVLIGRRFDLAVFGWRIGPVPPCALYTSAQIASDDNPGGANASGYANPAYDEACWRALNAPDTASSQAHAEAQRRLADDLPMLPLFYRPRHGAALPGVSGYVLDGNSESELWNIEFIGIK